MSLADGADFLLLDAAEPVDRARWLATWQGHDTREVHGHPDYVQLFAAPGDRVVCALLDLDGSGAMMPLILRPLSREPWTPKGELRWDATSPYGYGGPYYWGEATAIAPVLWAELNRALTEANVVSTFIRFALTEGSTVGFPGATTTAMSNVVRTLALSEEALWRDYASKVRKNVKRARSLGLTVEVDTRGTRLEDFLDIYYETMTRRSAADSFYFPRDFFSNILERLADNAALFHVISGEDVISTELVLLSPQRMYSFLGGTRREALNTRANDLLKHEAICWGRTRGLSEYVLGGGYGANDGIYRYKLAFAPTGARTFHIGKLIQSQADVDELVQLRSAGSDAPSDPWHPREGFFPPYRS